MAAVRELQGQTSAVLKDHESLSHIYQNRKTIVLMIAYSLWWDKK